MNAVAARFGRDRSSLREQLHMQAREVVSAILQTGDIVGENAEGRVLIQLAADDWMLEELAAFDAHLEDLEPETEVEDNYI